MGSTGSVPITEADWAVARTRARRTGTLTGIVGAFAGGLQALVAIAVADAIATGTLRYVVAYACMVIISAPLIAIMIRFNVRERAKSDALVQTLTQQLAAAIQTADEQALHSEALARRQEFASELANALEMADDEPDVIQTIEVSFAATLPNSAVELLLADNSHAHLARVASASPTDTAPGCGVDSPEQCPAARRAQMQYFPDSDAVDTCPKLRGRSGGPVSALCVPVAIMGRTVGVIHATDKPNSSMAGEASGDLTTLAKLAGARLGLIRIMAEAQLQASTDSLTGLLNRRSFEQRVAVIRRDNPLLSLAMLDLDHFKELNDTYGHETGDRALRLFAQVLTGSVRAHDLVGRHGGEEFVVALVGCTAATAGEILQALRTRLDAALTVAALPAFTVSGGVVEARQDESFPSVAGRADANLFEAKRDGRDRIVVRDAAGRTVLTDSVSGPAEPNQRHTLREAEIATID